MSDLVVASLFFIGTHLGLSSTMLREQIVERVGENVFRILYSLVALAAITWMVMAYNTAPFVMIWPAGPALGHLPLLIMPVALILLIGGVSGPNPTAVGQSVDADQSEPARGVLRITRHPVMWAIGLWGIVHLLANGDFASLLFFGGLAFLALFGAAMQDIKRTSEAAPGWGVFLQNTSHVPFAAIIQGRQRLAFGELGWLPIAGGLVVYVVLIILHPWLFGVSAVG